MSEFTGGIGKEAFDFRRGNVAPPTTPVASRVVDLPLPGRDRTGWRVSALLLVLYGCHGRSATVEQLHVLLWALRDDRNAIEMWRVWEGAPGAPRILRAFDPDLDDTLAIARAAGLVDQRPNGRQFLTDLGASVVRRIRDEEGLMESERTLLARLGTVSETSMWKRLGRPSRATPASGLA